MAPLNLSPLSLYISRLRSVARRVVHGSLFLDPTRPGEKLTRPDPRLPTKSLTRPDPTRGPTLPPYVHSLIEKLFINYLIVIY